jgi:hypothetical protein
MSVLALDPSNPPVSPINLSHCHSEKAATSVRMDFENTEAGCCGRLRGSQALRASGQAEACATDWGCCDI